MAARPLQSALPSSWAVPRIERPPMAVAGGCRRRLGDPSEPGIELVADSSGEVCAWWHEAERGRCLHVPQIGSFRPGSRAVVAAPAAGVETARLRAAYRRLVLPLVLVELGRDLLHASAVVAGGVAVGFCGRSGAGKSTLARACVRRGWSPWADDALEFHAGAGGGVETYRLNGRAAAAAPLVALFLLERESGDGPAPVATTASALPPAAAFPAVLAHAHAGDLGDTARRRRLARSYLRLVDRVPVFVLRYPSGPARLARVAEVVAAEVAAGATTRARRARS